MMTSVRKTISLIILTTALIWWITGCEPGKNNHNSVAQLSTGTTGMVSSAHELATDAGLTVLKNGGNAFDAAVTVAAVLNVVEPMMSGIGGYGTIMVYSAEEQRSRFLNSSGRIPQNVNSDVYRPPTPNYLEHRRGAKAVSTPGNVNAWEAMWSRYGTADWNVLFEDAIRIAEEGFVLDRSTARMIEIAFPEFPEHAKSFYGRMGIPLAEGDTLLQKDLARSLRLIASKGAKVVHGGELGVAIDRVMKEQEGFLTLTDLKNNEAEWWDPIEINYRGYRVATASPPANSWPALLRLGIMSRFDLQAMGHNSPDYLHTFAEVTKHAFWARLRWAGDPEIDPPPLDRLLSETYWSERADNIDPQKASEYEPPSTFSESSMNTTHFVVADKWGNVVSATQTLGNLFGSKIMPEGTGIWLNNSLQYSTFEPKGNPMDAFPGRHKLSGDVPLFVMKNGRPWIAIGTPGGHTIAQTVPQMVMNMVDFGMDIQQAIDAPRISFVEPDRIVLEDKIADSVRLELRNRGHNIEIAGGIGNAHGLTVEYDSTGIPVRFTGGADSRRGLGKAAGF